MNLSSGGEHVEGDLVVRDGDIAIRRMRDDEDDYLKMVEWRNLDHVRRWWDPDLPPLTLETAIQEYHPETSPESPSVPCIIELDERPIGFIQFYRWISYAEEADLVGIPSDERTYSVDVFLGVEELTGRGIGTRIISLLCDHLTRDHGASSVALTTDVRNVVAQRCYEKAGFRKVKQVLDTDTVDGERALCWLMVREANH